MNTTQEPEKRRRKTQNEIAKFTLEASRNREGWQLRANEEGIRFVSVVAAYFGVTNAAAAGIMENAEVTFVRKEQPTKAERDARAAKQPDLPSGTSAIEQLHLRLDRMQEALDASTTGMDVSARDEIHLMKGRINGQHERLTKAEDHVDSLRRITQGQLGRINEHQQLFQGIGEAQTHLGSEGRRVAGVVQLWGDRFAKMEAQIDVLTGMLSLGAQRSEERDLAFQQLTSRVIKLEQDQA